ncbi:MAG: FecR domain-containing protein [Sedimentisphaerales bacterium]|nr:FecR domain-containing protein [Sedimentisphaerales bacterium]
MMTPQEKIHLCQLILKFKDQTIRPDEFALLDKTLQERPEGVEQLFQIIEVYYQLMRTQEMPIRAGDHEILDQALWRAMADVENKAPSVEIQPAEKPSVLIQKVELSRMRHKIRKSTIFSLMASAAALLFFFLFPRFVPVGDRVLVGKLTRQIDARWEMASGQVAVGDDLYAGPLKLAAGFAEIELDSGASVIVEAPAQFTLESANQLYLQQGRLVAKINKTSRNPFVVYSSYASIVDYGTEFGVQVDDRSTLTHVYQGRVELRSGSNPLRFEHRKALTQDQGGQVNAQGDIVDTQDSAGLFVRQREFEARTLAAQGSAYHRWLMYSYQLRRDPDMVVYYTFERDSANLGTLVNQAQSSLGALDAHLTGRNGNKPQWSQGRFSQKSALIFDESRPGYAEVASDERLSINGPITLAAWIYCESAEDGGHVVSNRTESALSPCNYQLGYRGKEKERRQYVHMARKINGEDDKNQINSKPLPDDLKGWILVAATHDNQTLKYYINGTLFDTQYWPHKIEVIEAGLRIGSDFRTYDESSFNGKIDEIAILRRIMSEREIAEMYRAGKP